MGIYDLKTSERIWCKYFCHYISQLTQLISWNNPHPERFDNLIYTEQGEESLQQIISILQEESLLQIVTGICDPHAILQNLSERDICFDSKDLVDRESNDVDLHDQRDSKGQRFINLKEGFPKDHLQLARNILNQLPIKFPANSVAPCKEVWNIGYRTFVLILVELRALSAIQQL